MTELHNRRLPNENDTYRQARNALLKAEIALRQQIEDVAAMRRALPRGGAVAKDYVFTECRDEGEHEHEHEVRLSQLFEGEKTSLVIYNFMYAPQWGQGACPMCVSMLDSLNASAPHIMDRVNLAVVARAPACEIHQWAQTRSWHNLRLLSAKDNTYNVDYWGEDDGRQMPMLHVFETTAEGIFHVYGSEIFYTPWVEGQHARHVDMIWPLWNVFDMTREGRGTDWFPKLTYE